MGFGGITFSLLGFNWLDIAIIIVFLLYALEGYSQGFIAAFLDLVSFICSFLLGLKFYGVIGMLLAAHFTLSPGFANALGFFITAFISEIILNMVFRALLGRLIKETRVGKLVVASRYHKIAGIVPGFFSALIIISFVLTLIIALPLSPFVKHTISNAKLGNMLVVHAQGVEKNIDSVFGGAIKDTLNFLTVEPQSNESVALRFKTTEVATDTASETQMLQLVNKERVSRGLSPLDTDIRLRDVARGHASDMFARGYFSHNTPDGLSPFDRMAKANVQYNYAGENLALAPNVELAHQGLMNSPGHRANILSKNYKKVGIGVIDGGQYGEMFVQEFTD